MIKEAIENLREKIEGLELSIGCEEAVMAYLQPEMDKFNLHDPEQPCDQRRVRQWIASRNLVRNWKADLAALALGLNELKKLPQ